MVFRNGISCYHQADINEVKTISLIYQLYFNYDYIVIMIIIIIIVIAVIIIIVTRCI